MNGEVVVHESPVVLAVAILTPELAARGISCPIGSHPVDGEAADADYPPLWVTLTWSGTSRLNPVQRDAALIVEVTGDDEAAVEDTAALCEGILLAVDSEYVAGTWVYGIYERTGIVNDGDYARQRERCTFSVLMRTRGRTA